MNLQELFNKIIKHQRKQGKQCRHPRTKDCRMRYLHLRDPLGLVIPDDIYKETWEDFAAPDDLFELIIIYVLNYTPKQLALLRDLQRIHDKYSTLDKWEEQWQITATLFGIDYLPASGQLLIDFSKG